MEAGQIKDIDSYISGFPKETQKILIKLRKTIKQAAPAAEETINYQMPTFVLHGNLVHFAAYKNHIGFYPTPTAIVKFHQQLSAWEGAKGSVKFPIEYEIPYGLISEIVKFRVNENEERAATKTKKTLKICPQGHKYYKSSDCPTCPVCEQENKPDDGFLAVLSAPARRALENNGIKTLQQLSTFNEAQILALHGMGPASMPKLRKALQEKGLSFAHVS
jgi:uncharacterized protein YdhG (YjbR/CyaY superfamily)